MAVSFQAKVVFPVDRPPIEHGYVTIDGRQIVAVGEKPAAGTIVDLGSVALLPGLVNAHNHLEFSGLHQPLGVPGMPLADWIRLVIAERGRRGTTAHDAIAAGLSESLQCGVTCIGNISAASTVLTADTPVRLGGRTDIPVRHDGRTDIPVRHGGRTDIPVRLSGTGGQECPSPRLSDGQECPSYVAIATTQFAEVIGFSRARAASALAAATALLDELCDDTSGSRIGLSPHAPYTVSPDLLTRLIALASERHLPVAMHLAESADELAFLQTGGGTFRELLEERSMWDAEAVPRGSRPLDYLRQLAEAPRSLVIHGNYLDPDEHAFLAAHRERMSLVYCPRTHAYFGHAAYPLATLLTAGVHVALGTDSRASNPNLDLWAEMQHLASTHPNIEPHEILRMGTLSGAEALSRDDELGSITPGKLANLLAIPLATQETTPRQLLLHLLFTHNNATRRVWLRGEQITVAHDLG